MIKRWAPQLRALLALALFTTSDGGAQLLDALVFHTRPERTEAAHMNAGDNCHAKRCDLGAPITSPPPAALPEGPARFEPPSRRLSLTPPDSVVHSTPYTSSLGSRAPPIRS